MDANYQRIRFDLIMLRLLNQLNYTPPNLKLYKKDTCEVTFDDYNQMYRLFINGEDYMSYKINVHDVCNAIRYLAPSTLTGPVSIGYGESVPVRKLAEKFGQGDLPLKEYTPGEAEDNVADISIMASTGWMPTISVLDSVE